jgi:hypothetical protein
MAEFKLGRIRFVWKDEWQTGRTYFIDDVVRVGGKTYICVVGHASSPDFYTDLTFSPTRWNQMSDGQEWTGDWTVDTFYKIGDIVKYGGLLYTANSSHTSAATLELGLEANQELWDLFSEGIEWKDNWSVNTRYKKNDVVRYGGYTYVANTGHTSAATIVLGLEANQELWDEFNQGIEYKGSWNGSSVKYKINDVVKQGANLWIATTNHVSTANFTTDAATYWNVFVEGLEFETEWNVSVTYQLGDIVRYGGNQYVAKTNHVGQTPSTSTSNWDLFSEGINFLADWSSATAYRPGDVVRLQGYTYLATADSTNQEPPNLTYWERLNSGIQWQGEWLDDTIYKAGDAVRYGSNAYICILAHQSEGDDGSTIGPEGGGADQSRPDQDVTGTYWNLLAIGTETSVLEARGDLVYYGGSGPTKLPIGLEGQILRSNGEDPVWVTLGQTEHVYYVATHGTDLSAPIHGKSIDKPWKTIRYACEQVEKGTHNPNTQRLLELNRVFIQREVTEWIQYQIASATVGSIWENFVYEDFKCERDVGFIIDRLIWDIGHGGNLKIRAAAQSLLGVLSDGPFSKPEEDAPYATLSSERDQGTAAYNYMLEVIEAVLNNEEPDVNYQNTNTDNSSAVVAQYIDTALVAEPNVLTKIQDLVSIITTAIETGDADTIPARYVPSTLISIATGRYRETLPIIVPAYACVQGDELRSTNAGPAGSLVDISDSYYSLDSLGRISSIIGDIVTGTSVTPTTGNNSLQSQQWPFADVDESTAVTSLVDVMQNQIDFKLNTMHTAYLTDPVGYNVGYLAGYGDARKLIKENKRFLQEEVIAYLEAEYANVLFTGSISGTTLTVTGVEAGTLPIGMTIKGEGVSVGTTIESQLSGITGKVGTYEVSISQTVGSTAIRGENLFGRTDSRRDTGYIIDALVYDLTYGGNAQSVKAGLAYFDGDNISNAYLPVSIKALVLDSLEFLKDRLQDVATATVISSPLQDVVPQFIDTAGSAGAATAIENNVDEIIDIIDNGPGAATLTDPTPANGVNTTTALITAYGILNAAVSTITGDTVDYIDATYPSLVYDTVKAERDVEIILKAVGYDFMFNSNYQSIKAAHAYLRDSATNVYSSELLKAATLGAIEFARTQAIATVGGDTTAITRINSLMALIYNIVYSGSNEGQVCSTELRNRDYAILQLERNRDFIVAEVRAYIEDQFTDTATATTASSDSITISDTSWLRRNVAIEFTGTTFGGIVPGTTYYVQNVINGTSFTISETRDGEAIALTNGTGSITVSLVYNQELCLRDVHTYIDALKWDLKYTSNYKSRFVARYYANAVLGSVEEDMYYLRDGTGVRDQTLEGLNGQLTPANEYGTSRVTAGAYCSLDPGWGPADFRTWIISRSPYVQGVTTFGNGAVGQKIDGALHLGGNDSIVSNDFTQVISDGIGAWITNNGRAELVSVFTYYSHVGYLAENGGRIRGTNGNNSYGDFGSVAEGFDDTETPDTAVVDNIFQFKATIADIFTDGAEMIAVQFDNAGIEYNDVTYNLTGGGQNASAVGNEFRDDGVYQVRLLELAAEGNDGAFGGEGYVTNSNTAQAGTLTQITIAATDSETSTAYPGMKITVTGGAGVGQYAIIATYNSGTKVATVVKETTGAAGWDHYIPGTTIVSPDASSTYTIEPALSFSAPAFNATTSGVGQLASSTYKATGYAEDFTTFLNVAGTSSEGTGATFNVVKKGTKYFVFISSGGSDYPRLETITILGTSLNGTTPENDITITATAVNSLTGAIQSIDFEGVGSGGNYIALTYNSSAAKISKNGTTWSDITAISGRWSSLASGRITAPQAANTMVAGEAYIITNLGNSLFTAAGAKVNIVGTTFIATEPTSGTGTVTPIKSRVVAVTDTATNLSMYSDDAGQTWNAGGTLPAVGNWSVAYGNGRWVAVNKSTTNSAYSIDGGETWTAGGALATADWTSIAFGAGKFVAIANGSTAISYSIDGGVVWTAGSGLPSSNWESVTFGNNRFIAVSSSSGTTAAYSLDGITWVSATITSGSYTKVAYGQGVFLAVGASTTASSSEDGIVWSSRTTAINSSTVIFGNSDRNGRFLTTLNSSASSVQRITLGATTRARASVSNGKIFQIKIIEPGSAYGSAPTMTIVDPNNVFEAPFTVRTGSGVLANPTWINRGSGYITGSGEVILGDGYADNYQPGSFVAVRRISQRPIAGSNVVFGHLPDRTFKLVNVVTFLGEFDGEYTAFLQISPRLTISEAPDHLEDITTRIRYSQVRLTGHDFLDIGTGSFVESNYPNTPIQDPIPANETVENNGGRVFFTATDQDGNFRVGGLFAIEQSTGIATLNADAFNISGLQELNLGNVTLGGGSATITEFSTDPFFTADSDNIVPTQRAIKAYIASQIGGGGASLNVNSVTAGSIFISSNVITTVTNASIKMNASFEFRGGVTGLPIAFNFFLN